VDSRVVLDDGCDDTTILFEELGGPVADSAKALNGESAPLNAFRKTDLVAESLVASQLADSVVDTETSGLATAIDTTLSDKLTSAATFRVDILFTLNVHVGILDPGHDLLVGTHIGSETINSSTDEALLDELHSVLAGNSFKLGLGEVTRVDLDTTLTATECLKVMREAKASTS
jgi:hypothetical protein